MINLKKIVFLSISLLVGILIYNKNEEVIIPSDAIRLRIIANSNDIKDLYEKKRIKSEIENDIYEMVNSTNSGASARMIIKNNIGVINELVASKTNDFKVDYGFNYFPRKVYKGVIYEKGEYESLVITLGKGLGDNWWCVLYPPLCLISDNETTDDVTYRSIVLDVLNN